MSELIRMIEERDLPKISRLLQLVLMMNLILILKDLAG